MKRAITTLLDAVGLGPPLRRARARRLMARSVEPLSELWGLDRGVPPHRVYLEQFLLRHRSDIRGRVLEFQEDSYATRFGGAAVTRLDILHVEAGNPIATIVADLTKPNDIPSDTFDCIICTHVLHMIFDVEKATREMARLLRPGGVLLAAVPMSGMYAPKYRDMWRMTPAGLEELLWRSFGKANVQVEAFGNSLIAAGELRGLVAREFREADVHTHDERFAVEVCGRAVKVVQ